MTVHRMTAILLAAALAGCTSAGPGAPQLADTPTAPSTQTVACDFYPLVESKVIWYGLLAHSNGKIYAGLNYHIAALAELDPATGKSRIVARMTSQAIDAGGEKVTDPTLAGDLGAGPFPETEWKFSQDKIHTQLHEGRDGRVYGATHVKVEEPNSTRKYGGGHFFAYDPKTGKTEDFGWVRRHEGIITSCYDRGSNTLYGISWPTGYFVRCRPDEKEYFKRLEVLDMASSRLDCASRYVAVVRDGRVYVPDGATGAIRVWDPKTQWLHDAGLTTPTGPTDGDGDYLRKTARWRNWWITGTLSPDGMHIFLTSQRGGRLIEVDATAGKWGRVLDHGRTVPWATDDNWAGPYCGIMVFARDGQLYHTVGRQLLRYDPRSGRAVDLGRTVLGSDPRTELSLGSGGQLGTDGRVYAAARAGKQRGIAVFNPADLADREGNLLRVSPNAWDKAVEKSK